MDPRCRDTRDRLAAEVEGVVASNGPDRDHLKVCADCRAFAEDLAARRRRQREALADLPRLRAPEDLAQAVTTALSAEGREARGLAALGRLARQGAPAGLDGRVVASLQAGSRQERAVRHLGGLEARPAPADLDRRALDGAEAADVAGDATVDDHAVTAGDVLTGRAVTAPPSPAVLERLVREDLEDLPRALTRRFTDKLTRLEAPAELDRRVLADLSRAASPRGVFRGALLRGRFGASAWIAAAGAALLLGALGWARFGPDGSGHRDAPELASLSFEVHRLAPGEVLASDSVDPFAKQLATDFGDARLGFAPRSAEIEGVGDGLLASDAGDGGGGDGESADEPGEAPPEGGAPGGTTPGGGSASGGVGSGLDTSALQRAPRFSRDLLARMEQAPLVPVRLERRVEWYDVQHGALELAFLETILRDGAGDYAVRADDVLHPVMAPAEETTFLLLQSGRQGYVERHRNFLIRDRGLFLQNYSVIDLRQPALVAGVECLTLEVQSRIVAETTWRLAVDPRTGRVLREERYDDQGRLQARITVLQVDEQPDLSAEVLDGGASAWVPADGSALDGYDVYVPGQMPPGYLLVDTSRRIDGLGREWVRRRYTDGLCELFLLHELVPSATLQQRLATNAAGRDVVNSFAAGGVQVLDGEVRGVRVIALGRLQEYDLLQWIDSAL